MKYKVSSAAKPAVKKPFDFVAAYESLQQSFDSAMESYKELVASDARVVEIEDCLRDGQQALASIKKYGVTPANMSIINAGNNLDIALGCEKLDLTAIESLSESTTKLLASNYIKGLEGLAAENVQAFVARIKEFFIKIVNWLKDCFNGTAKLVKILKEEKFDGEFNGDTQITALEYSEADKALDDIGNLAKHLEDLVSVFGVEGTGSVAKDEIEKALNDKKTDGGPSKKSDTVSNLGYTKDNIGGLKDKFITTATGTVAKMDANWKKIQAKYKEYEAAAKGEDPSILEKGQMWFKGLRAASKCMGQVNKTLQTVGMSILSVKKAFKAAAPAEPAK